MKKVVIFVALAVMTAGLSQAGIRVGLRAGLNVSNQNFSDAKALSLSPDAKLGFQAGAVVELGVGDHWRLQPALLYNQQGYKVSDFNTTLSYLQLPVNLQYYFNLVVCKLIVQAGPYAALGLGGKYKLGDIKENIKFGSGDDAMYKALDFGVGIGAGVQVLSNIQAMVGYNWGLSNIAGHSINTITGGSGKARNNCLTITVSFLIGKQ